MNLDLCYIDLLCHPDIIYILCQMSSGPYGPIFKALYDTGGIDIALDLLWKKGSVRITLY